MFSIFFCNATLSSFLASFLRNCLVPAKILPFSRDICYVYLVAVFIFHSDRIMKQLEEEQQSRKSTEEKLKELEGQYQFLA